MKPQRSSHPNQRAIAIQACLSNNGKKIGHRKFG
jgi:hypothetical protein